MQLKDCYLYMSSQPDFINRTDKCAIICRRIYIQLPKLKIYSMMVEASTSLTIITLKQNDTKLDIVLPI